MIISDSTNVFVQIGKYLTSSIPTSRAGKEYAIVGLWRVGGVASGMQTPMLLVLEIKRTLAFLLFLNIFFYKLH